VVGARFGPEWLTVLRAGVVSAGLLLLIAATAASATYGLVVTGARLGRARKARVRVDGAQLVSYAVDGHELVLDFLTLGARHQPFGSPVFALRTPVGGWVDIDQLVRLDYWVRNAIALRLRLRREGKGRLRLDLSDGHEELRISTGAAGGAYGVPALSDAS